MSRAIFIVNKWSRSGGLEIVTQEVANVFKTAGYRVSVYSVQSSGRDYSEKGMDVHFLCPKNRLLRALWHRYLKYRYLAYILRNNVTCGDAVVFGHTYLLPALNYVSLPENTLRWVWTHDKEVWGGAAVKWKPWFDRLTRVVAVSQYTADNARQGGTITPVSVVENSVNSEWFTPTPTPEKIRRDEILICSRIPDIFRYKGHERLLQALPIAEKFVGHRLKLRVVGCGDGLNELRQLAKTYGVEDRVLFAGYISDDDQLEAFRHCGVFCMPSTGEGFGLVYAEAEACARPVVVSTTGGAPETAINGVTGLYADPLDIEANARAIATILSNPMTADEMGRRGRALVEAKFTKVAFQNRVLSLILQEHKG